jgi:hypothetical protein
MRIAGILGRLGSIDLVPCAQIAPRMIIMTTPTSAVFGSDAEVPHLFESGFKSPRRRDRPGEPMMDPVRDYCLCTLYGVHALE